MIASNSLFSVVNASYSGNLVDINFRFDVPYYGRFSIAFIFSSTDGAFFNDLNAWRCKKVYYDMSSLQMFIVNSSASIFPRISQAAAMEFPVDNWMQILAKSYIGSGTCTSKYSQLNKILLLG